MIKGIAAPKRLSTCLKLKFYSMGYWFHTLQVIYTALKNESSDYGFVILSRASTRVSVIFLAEYLSKSSILILAASYNW